MKINRDMGKIIRTMRKAGASYATISRRVGVHYNSVAAYCNKYGIYPIKNPDPDEIAGGRHVRGLSPDDLRRLRLIDAENERAEIEERVPDYSGIR